MTRRDHDDEPAVLPAHARRVLARYAELHTMPPEAMDRVERVIRGARPRRTMAIVVGCAIAAACVLAWALADGRRGSSLAAGEPVHDQAIDRRGPDDHDGVIATPPIAPAELPTPVAAPAATAAPASVPTTQPAPMRRGRAPSTGPTGDDEVPISDDAATPQLPGNDLAAERALLSRAWQALADDDLEGALTLVETHRRDFASGALVPERDALAAVARCRRSPAAAKAIAAEFAQGHASAALRTRVREACDFVR